MIKLTVLQLFNAVPALQHLSRPDQMLFGEGAFALRKIIRRTAGDLEDACSARDTLLNDDNSTLNESGQRMLKAGWERVLLADPLFSKELSVDCDPLTPKMLSKAVLSQLHLEQLGPLLNDEG